MLTFTCHMAQEWRIEETTGDTWPANSCSAQWEGKGGTGRCIKQRQWRWRAMPHTCACHNIPTHVHLSSSIPMCSPNLSTHMHRRPDSEVFNMSPFGTNLSALRHHLAAGAVEGHSVPLFNSTSWMGVSVTGVCIKCWTHFGHLREEGQRIQCY